MRKPVGISLDRVEVDYPLYDAGSHDLQRRLIHLLSFGRIKPGHAPVSVVNALRNISFELKPGNAVGLIGRNGAGKSTLLKVMTGVLEPTRGNVTRQGQITGILTMGCGTEGELNGYQNIRRLGLLRGFTLQEIQEITPEVVEFAQLGEFINLPVRTYSAGMRMRLAFAIATTGTPDILLIDEVFGVGDAQFRDRAKERISNLLSRSSIIAISSHADNLIREFCTSCLYLENGEIKAYGETAEVLKLYRENQKHWQEHKTADNLSLRIA